MTSYKDAATAEIEKKRIAWKNELREMEEELERRNVHVYDSPDKELKDSARSQEEAPLMGSFDVTKHYEGLEKPADPGDTPRSATKSERSIKTFTSLVITDEESAEANRHHFDYPEIHELVFMQIGMSLGYCAYTTTAWLYIGIVRHEVFPDCHSVWSDPLLMWTCETTVLAFWTFPLFCCFFLLCFYYRDLLCTRLYYEMLAHNVFLDFENVDFTKSSAVRLMLVWMLVALMMYPMSGQMLSLSKTTFAFKITIPYWLPLFSFLGLLYASWDLESRLLSLSKYVEREFDQAKDHMGNSVFMRDHLCEYAFKDVQSNAHKVNKVHSTGSYIRAIVKRAQSILDEVKEEELQNRKKGRSILHSRFLVVFSESYWVSNLLYCRALEDYRAKRFRKWFKWYKLYTYVLLVFLTYLMLATVVSHLHHQHHLATSWFTQWLDVEHFLIVPVGGKSAAKKASAFFASFSRHFLDKQV